MKDTLIIQAIGAIGYIELALSYFKKEKKQILSMQIIAYIFFTIHYYLLNGITGAICNIIGLFALITIYVFDKYKIKNKPLAVAFFVILLLIVNIKTYQNVFSIFPIIASTTVIISFLDENENIIRAIGVIAAVCWLIYAIAYKSYIAIAFEIITLANVWIAFMENISHRKKDKTS